MSWIEKGYAFAVAGQYKEAIEAFNKAIEEDPKDEKAYYNRGAIHGSLGNYNEAISDFEKTIELNPKYEKAFYSRGIAYLRLGNKKEAAADLKIAVELGYKQAEEYLNNELAAYLEETPAEIEKAVKPKKKKRAKTENRPGQPSINPEADTFNTKKMTFYVKESLLEKLYNFSYWDRHSITEALNIAIEDGMKDKNTKEREKK